MIQAISRILGVFNNRKPNQKYWCSSCGLKLSADECHSVRGRCVCFICGQKIAHSCPKCGADVTKLGLSGINGMGHVHCSCGEELVPEWDRHFGWKAVRQQ